MNWIAVIWLMNAGAFLMLAAFACGVLSAAESTDAGDASRTTGGKRPPMRWFSTFSPLRIWRRASICAGTDRARATAALSRAQCGPPDNRFHAAERSGMCGLDASARYLVGNAEARRHRRRGPPDCTSTIRAGVQRPSAACRETLASLQPSDTISTGLCRLTSNAAAVSLICASVGRLASLPRCWIA